MNQKHRIAIVGGGFAGLYAALELEKSFAARPDVEITVINKENFFLFTPMLHEIAAGDLDLTNIVNPIRKLLKNVAFFEGRGAGNRSRSEAGGRWTRIRRPFSHD
jgi:NADH dehydrogenase